MMRQKKYGSSGKRSRFGDSFVKMVVDDEIQWYVHCGRGGVDWKGVIWVLFERQNFFVFRCDDDILFCAPWRLIIKADTDFRVVKRTKIRYPAYIHCLFVAPWTFGGMGGCGRGGQKSGRTTKWELEKGILNDAIEGMPQLAAIVK